MQNSSNVTSRLRLELESCRLDKPALQKLCAILEERVAAAAAQEVQQMVQGTVPDDVFNADKQRVADAFFLWITVRGANHKELFGRVGEVFASPNFPDQIESFYANSTTALKARYNWHPRNSVELFLDFKRPAPLDFNFLPSHGTNNESNFEVQGQDATWTNGLFHELETFFSARTVPLGWIHKPSVWDAILWLLGMPLCLWVCYRFAPLVEQSLAKYSTFLEAAAYIYIFIVSMTVLRAGFHYARWLWPRAEYVATGSTALRHRLLLGAIAISIAAAFIYDLIKIAAS